MALGSRLPELLIKRFGGAPSSTYTIGGKPLTQSTSIRHFQSTESKASKVKLEH
jgi:hypothetical protein